MLISVNQVKKWKKTDSWEVERRVSAVTSLKRYSL
jgi:uncharacterized protein YjcR